VELSGAVPERGLSVAESEPLSAMGEVLYNSGLAHPRKGRVAIIIHCLPCGFTLTSKQSSAHFYYREYHIYYERYIFEQVRDAIEKSHQEGVARLAG
jgi:hypothetical protein